MANKITNAMQALADKLQELVASGDLRKVKWGAVNPFAEMQLPIVGLVLGAYGRNGFHWTAEVDLVIVTRVGGGGRAEDQANIELAARVDGAVAELVAAGTAGAVISNPKWTPWESAVTKENPVAAIGNVAEMIFSVETPLLIAE